MMLEMAINVFFFSSRRRHTRFDCDWSSDVCSSDLPPPASGTSLLMRERIVMALSIESLLAARVFLSPKLLGHRLFFLSNLGQGGHLSLYAMETGGSVPEQIGRASGRGRE